MIIVSFVMLIFFSYNALKSQDIVAQNRSISEKFLEIDKISSDFFSKYKTGNLPFDAIIIPMGKPVYPLLKVPANIESKEALMQYAHSLKHSEFAI